MNTLQPKDGKWSALLWRVKARWVEMIEDDFIAFDDEYTGLDEAFDADVATSITPNRQGEEACAPYALV